MVNSVILIGMPGSGKSTLGKMLAEKISYEFIDMDKFIEDKSRQTIGELFGKGEHIFRDIESEACKELSKIECAVIATGGGVVKRKENMECFKGSVIVFINRPIDKILCDIDMEERPLLKLGIQNLKEIYNERIKLYEIYKDVEVKNTSSLENAVKELRETLKFN